MGSEEQRNNNLAIGGPGLFPPKDAQKFKFCVRAKRRRLPALTAVTARDSQRLV